MSINETVEQAEQQYQELLPLMLQTEGGKHVGKWVLLHANRFVDGYFDTQDQAHRASIRLYDDDDKAYVIRQVIPENLGPAPPRMPQKDSICEAARYAAQKFRVFSPEERQRQDDQSHSDTMQRIFELEQQQRRTAHRYEHLRYKG